MWAADPPATATRPPPNAVRAAAGVVIILADDLGYGDVSACHAASKITTPHLDRLAAGGMSFTDAHSPSSVCTPTRYGLLTGRYCWRSRLKKGVLSGTSPALIEPGRPTVASVLKARGWTTACVGKWHLGLGDAATTDFTKPLRPGPLTVGFDRFYGIAASLDMPPYVLIRDDGVPEPGTASVKNAGNYRTSREEFWRAGPITPGMTHGDFLPRMVAEAESWLAARKAGEPFLLYLPLTSPHTPWAVAPEFKGKSPVGPYGDFVLQTDAAVGRVMAALAKAGVADDTLVVFTSDNGSCWWPEDLTKTGHDAAAGRRGQKADVWEGGHRVPLLVRWPGRIKAGTTSDHPVCLTDLFATVAEVTGAALPEDGAEDSFSFAGVLLGRPAAGPVRDHLIHHSADGTFAIRQGGFKLVPALGSHGFSDPKDEKPAPGGPAGQLYDFSADPGESRNLWLDKPAEVARLTALLEAAKSAGRTRPATK